MEYLIRSRSYRLFSCYLGVHRTQLHAYGIAPYVCDGGREASRVVLCRLRVGSVVVEFILNAGLCVTVCVLVACVNCEHRYSYSIIGHMFCNQRAPLAPPLIALWVARRDVGRLENFAQRLGGAWPGGLHQRQRGLTSMVSTHLSYSSVAMATCPCASPIASSPFLTLAIYLAHSRSTGASPRANRHVVAGFYHSFRFLPKIAFPGTLVAFACSSPSAV